MPKLARNSGSLFIEDCYKEFREVWTHEDAARRSFQTDTPMVDDISAFRLPSRPAFTGAFAQWSEKRPFDASVSGTVMFALKDGDPTRSQELAALYALRNTILTSRGPLPEVFYRSIFETILLGIQRCPLHVDAVDGGALRSIVVKCVKFADYAAKSEHMAQSGLNTIAAAYGQAVLAVNIIPENELALICLSLADQIRAFAPDLFRTVMQQPVVALLTEIEKLEDRKTVLLWMYYIARAVLFQKTHEPMFSMRQAFASLAVKYVRMSKESAFLFGYGVLDRLAACAVPWSKCGIDTHIEIGRVLSTDRLGVVAPLRALDSALRVDLVRDNADVVLAALREVEMNGRVLWVDAITEGLNRAFARLVLFDANDPRSLARDCADQLNDNENRQRFETAARDARGPRRMLHIRLPEDGLAIPTFLSGPEEETESQPAAVDVKQMRPPPAAAAQPLPAAAVAAQQAQPQQPAAAAAVQQAQPQPAVRRYPPRAAPAEIRLPEDDVPDWLLEQIADTLDCKEELECLPDFHGKSARMACIGTPSTKPKIYVQFMYVFSLFRHSIENEQQFAAKQELLEQWYQATGQSQNRRFEPGAILSRFNRELQLLAKV